MGDEKEPTEFTKSFTELLTAFDLLVQQAKEVLSKAAEMQKKMKGEEKKDE